MNPNTKKQLNTLRGFNLVYSIMLIDKNRIDTGGSILTSHDKAVAKSSGLGTALEQARARKLRARELNKIRRASRKRNRAA